MEISLCAYWDSIPCQGKSVLFATLLFSSEKINEMYPNQFIKFEKDRTHVMSTLFDLPGLFPFFFDL